MDGPLELSCDRIWCDGNDSLTAESVCWTDSDGPASCFTVILVGSIL